MSGTGSGRPAGETVTRTFKGEGEQAAKALLDAAAFLIDLIVDKESVLRATKQTEEVNHERE
jgi:hypothetical protein